MASGPFRMEPGDRQEIVLAIVFSNGNDRLDSVYRLLGAPASLSNALPYIMAFDTTTAPAPPPPEIPPPVTYGLGHSPNPVTQMVVFRFELPASVHANLALYDVLGRQLEVLAEGDFEPGLVAVNKSLADLPSGTYFYRLETQSFRATKTLTVIR